MNYPVFRGAGYVLVHTPDMIEHGSTCAIERETNPDSEFLKEIKKPHKKLRRSCRLPSKPSLYRKKNSWRVK